MCVLCTRCTQQVVVEEAGSTAFPWLLRALDIPPYDLHKIIESVVRCEPSLNAQLTKHLGFVEQHIICELAWEYASPVYDLISRNGSVPASITAPLLGGNAPLSSSETPSSLQMCLSPRRPINRSVQRPASQARASLATGSPALTAGPAEEEQAPLQRKSRSLDIFFRKLYRVANMRLKLYCETLELDERFRRQVWTCFEHSVTQRSGGLLLEGRHVDQLLLCAVYAVGRIYEVRHLTFKHIIGQYVALPGRRRQTCRDVLIMRGNEAACRQYGREVRVFASADKDSTKGDVYEGRGNIVQFYNLVYTPRMKTFVLRFSPASPATEQPPLAEVPHNHLDSRPQRLQVPGTSDVYLSPLRRTRIPPESVVDPRAAAANSE